MTGVQTCALPIYETAFDAYHGPIGRNEDHIQLTPANVEFIRNEILKQTPPPVFQTTAANICLNGTPLTLTLKTECRVRPGQPATTYRCVLAGPLRRDASLPADGSVQRVSYDPTAGAGDPEVYVYATRAGQQESAPLLLYLNPAEAYLGLSTTTCGWFPGAILCQGSPVELATELSVGDAASIRWYADGAPITALNGKAQGSYLLPNRGGAPYTTTITADIDNPCQPGTRLAASNPLVFKTGGNNTCVACRPAAKDGPVAPTALATLYPNPANGEVTLTPTRNATAAQDTTAGFEATIYDGHGRLVLHQACAQPALRLATHTWLPGLYQVVVRQGQHVSRQQLSIQH